MNWAGKRWSSLMVAVVVAVAGCQRASRSPTAVEATPEPPAVTEELPPASQGCGLPAGPGDGLHCPYDGATFVPWIDKAIEMAEREHPELFDFTQCFSPLACKVRNEDRYHEEIVKNLRRMDLCAIFDGAEIAVKWSNDFNDQYRVYSSEGWSRWGIGSYRSTCSPAWF
ncbi:MAG TPA: hypothetical protein VGQ78_04685 [Vicinamibacteria bacterium]|nr:hypothetical protein [Vicinamibacteria bacterium]